MAKCYGSFKYLVFPEPGFDFATLCKLWGVSTSEAHDGNDPWIHTVRGEDLADHPTADALVLRPQLDGVYDLAAASPCGLDCYGVFR